MRPRNRDWTTLVGALMNPNESHAVATTATVRMSWRRPTRLPY